MMDTSLQHNQSRP